MYERAEDFRAAASDLLEIIYTINDGRRIDPDDLFQQRQNFEYRARSYNYYKFQCDSRVVRYPLSYASDLRILFNDLRSNSLQLYTEVALAISDITILFDSVRESWTRVKNSSDMCRQYVDLDINKVELSEYFQTERYSSALQTVELFFNEARIRSTSILTSLTRMEDAYKKVWTNVLMETSLSKFYKAVYTDVNASIYDNEVLNELLYIFVEMTEQDENFIREDPSRLFTLMNADVSVTSVQDAISGIDNLFQDIMSTLDISESFSNHDVTFLETTAILREGLRDFLEGSQVDAVFYK